MPTSRATNQIDGGSASQDTAKKTRMPARLPARFHEYPYKGRGASSIWRLTVCPSGMKMEVINHRRIVVRAAASRKAVQLRDRAEPQICTSWAAPRDCDKISVTSPLPQG